MDGFVVDGIDLVVIDAGDALIGSTDADVERTVDRWLPDLIEPSYGARFESWIRKEQPQHRVALDAFAIGRYPVTNGDYRRCLTATGGQAPHSLVRGEPDDHPVWDPDIAIAEHYLGWLSSLSQRPWRLPTEAEWEHAARANRSGEAGDFPWGDQFDHTMCNTIEAGIASTTAVTAYRHAASPFGVVDLAGNVEEWTSSDYRPYPDGALVEDDLTEALGNYRVLRGGSFNRGGDLARCARRHGPYPSDDYIYIGFRAAIFATNL